MSSHAQKKQSYQLRLGLGPSKVKIYFFINKKDKATRPRFKVQSQKSEKL